MHKKILLLTILLLFTLPAFSVYADEIFAEGDTFADDDDLYAEYSGPKVADTAIADPLYYMNKGMYYFNDKLYFWCLKPVSKGYSYVMPKPARIGIKNFFYNLGFPIRFVSNVLQFKFKEAGVETAIFLFNTTYGGLGFTQLAQDDLGWANSNEDLGQTLGSYSVGGGVYIVLPLFGPSSLRDTAGLVGDTFLYPAFYLDNLATSFIITGAVTVNNTSLRLGDYESLKDASVDPYAAMKDAYEKIRARKIKE
ncbi:MlaA family lipoprotein [Desulfotalea psychrophila]|uniref:VacJ family lipoprotein n=1 Tax=Desulfotalea psychrophila (strain LSv54 / DSM 12343) TaxID=177439 RepID=Q6AKW2_DESPS|nr:VacJ family lipoprotein [Desulfotalea psychrophila]CAG37013.1 conserved hypothetical protein [Desulfotalea psychrophila LSv54]